MLAQVKTVLPDLNLAEENVEPLLDEIVERSGLLLEIGGGERYQFAHLTLQEFFAAAELRDNPKELLQLFQADQETWRKTVNLWCGLDHDSTYLIQAIYDINPVTGFECLADATKVSPELADKIITNFKPKLGTETINKAFAAVAAGSRGKAVLDFLADTLVNSTESEQRIAAANTLSLTNLPKAAELLANCYENRIEEVRPALVRLGDLAIAKLETLAGQGHVDALDDLQAIGTIQTVNKLVPFLWHEDNNLASRAALNLASLLPKYEVENTLRDYLLTEEQRKKDWFKWVWEPFNEPASSSLPVIAGRIVYLINQVIENGRVSFHSTLAPEIVIPLAIQAHSEQPVDFSNIIYHNKYTEKFTTLLSELNQNKKLNYDDSWEIGRTLEKIFDRYNDKKDADQHEALQLKIQLMKESLKMIGANNLLNILNFLKSKMQFKLFPRLIGYTSPTINDWENVFSPIKYKFKKSLHFKLIILIIVSVSLVSLYEIIIYFLISSISIWKNSIFIFAILSIVGFFYGLNYSFDKNRYLSIAVFGFIKIPMNFIFSIIYTLKYKELIFIGKDEFWKFFPSLLFSPSIAYFTTLAMLNLSFSWWTITGNWLIFVLTITLLYLVGLRKKREAQNPLHGLLEPPTSKHQPRWFGK